MLYAMASSSTKASRMLATTAFKSKFTIEELLKPDERAGAGGVRCRGKAEPETAAAMAKERSEKCHAKGSRPKRARESRSGSAEKRPRTAFTADQLGRLQLAFKTSPYLTEERRARLASELGLGQSQVKIWFQNKRAKLKKKTRTIAT